ncbi:WXG100 family type VII secretion target [Actinoplanes sp. NPDC051346]|uniref:WXG100 family type VII secretion target n=1 Tax=Actinoplanes sp. NPDC051346 TaxID=3155048 RepID=UPI00341542C6
MTDNPLVAQAHSSTTWYTGLGLVEDAAQISSGIHDNSWVDGTLGGVGASLDVLGLAIDPLGSLVAWGVGWLMEHVKPLKEALDWLAGNPDEIAAHAATWRNVSASVSGSHQQYADAVRAQTAGWSGASGDAYRSHAARQLDAIGGIATASEAISYAVEGAGLLVGLVRGIVRDLIAQFVATLAARLPQWLAEAGLTLGIATPVVIGQVAALVAKWVNKIQHFIRALLNSLRRLNGKLDELTGVMEALKEALRRLSRSDPTTTTPGVPVNPNTVLHSRSGALSNREVLDQDVGLPRTEETVQHYADLAEVDFRGAPVEIVESADDISYLDYQGAVARTDSFGVQLGPAAFQDEETLIRTLGHESVHVRQYQDGRVVSVTGPLEDEAYAAEEGFVDTWRRNRG